MLPISIKCFFAQFNSGTGRKSRIFLCLIPSRLPLPAFDGNTYAQCENGLLAVVRGRLTAITENADAYVRDVMGDAKGIAYCIR